MSMSPEVEIAKIKARAFEVRREYERETDPIRKAELAENYAFLDKAIDIVKERSERESKPTVTILPKVREPVVPPPPKLDGGSQAWARIVGSFLFAFLVFVVLPVGCTSCIFSGVGTGDYDPLNPRTYDSDSDGRLNPREYERLRRYVDGY